MRALRAFEAPAHGLRRARGAHDRAKLFGRADAALARELVENGGDLFEAGERESSVADLECGRLAGLRESPPHLGLLERGLQRQNRRPSGRRSSQGCDESEDDGKLESVASLLNRVKVEASKAESHLSPFDAAA